MVTQYYITEAENEYVIKGNSAIVKCKIPSFVTDFVFIEAWVDEEGHELWKNNITDYGRDLANNLLKFILLILSLSECL